MQRLFQSRYWPWLRDIAIVALVFLAFRAYQQRDVPSGPAPALRGTDLSGATVDLADYRGAPVMLHFWATWCGVCRVEQPNVDAVAADMPVLTVASSSGTPAQVAAFVARNGIESRVVVDQHRALSRRYGVRAYPTTFIVDGDGVISHVEVGYTSELGLRARMWLARAW